MSNLSTSTRYAWQTCWIDGFMPSFSVAGLQALLKALQDNDARLIQGATMTPPPLSVLANKPVEAADAICFTFWQGDNVATVARLEECFARACHDADRRLGEVAACRYFLNWFDDNPRGEVFAALAPLIEEELNTRKNKQ